MAKRILVIDDEESIRKSFALWLDDMGYEVKTAASGEEGIKAEQERPNDLVFLDLKMPGMDGVETLRQLRLITEAPVYIVTAFHAEFLTELKMIRREGLEFELLRKPLDTDELLLVANSILVSPQDTPAENVPIRIALYVTGSTPRSLNAIEAVKGFLEERIPNNHSLEIIDVTKDPAMAAVNRVVATPTTVKTHPPPQRRMIGDITKEAVTKWLGFDP